LLSSPAFLWSRKEAGIVFRKKKHSDPERQHEPGNELETREQNQTLWLMTASPLIWAAHFLASYATAAIWCAKLANEDGSLTGARWAIAIYTVLALFGIALVGWIGLHRQSFGAATVPHEFDSPADRHRFLGFATILLSILSAVATIFVSLAAVFMETCS
jgi:hypothetical protein